MADLLIDGCFLNICLLLWTGQKLGSYFVDVEEIKNDICDYREFICTHCSRQSAGFFYIIICQNLFLPVHTHFHLCLVSARIYFNS